MDGISSGTMTLTHWGRVTHICVSRLTIIGSDNGLSPGRRQAIIWTNAGNLLIGPRGTNFSEILIGIQTFSFKKMHLKMSSAKWRPFCLGLNVLRHGLAFGIILSLVRDIYWPPMDYPTNGIFLTGHMANKAACKIFRIIKIFNHLWVLKICLIPACGVMSLHLCVNIFEILDLSKVSIYGIYDKVLVVRTLSRWKL